MKKCVPLVFGSKAMRNGLRSPHANVSWHFLPGAVRPLVLQRALSVPRNGFDGGMPPVDVMRRIFPTRTFWSRDASFAPPQPESPR